VFSLYQQYSAQRHEATALCCAQRWHDFGANVGKTAVAPSGYAAA
jgi:hypothetical protein